MGAEFNWWLLIVGVVVGGAVTWLVMADSNRRDQDIDRREQPAEAAWIARYLDRPGIDAETASQVLEAHRTYLGFPPPDVLVAADEVEAQEPGGRPNVGALEPGHQLETGAGAPGGRPELAEDQAAASTAAPGGPTGG
jgi:hypothetical protein